MSLQFRKFSQAQSINDFAQFSSPEKFSAKLASSTDTSLTVPGTGIDGNIQSSKKPQMLAIVRVVSGAEVYMAVNTAAAAPSGASFASTDSELVSGDDAFGRVVIVGDVLHFLTPGTDIPITVVFYAIPM